ncbi:LptE family protein [uncultured Hymenobacter sp.]|uniref:LptE family protein n=1 Tax=uncultured Hymenobacter sp. TaxID=170016 RepID=UPI0035CB6A59
MTSNKLKDSWSLAGKSAFSSRRVGVSAVLIRLMMSFLLPLSSCSVYSFSGTNIDPTVKTFSIQTIQNSTSLAPSFISQRFTEDLKDYFQRNTTLKLVPRDGDLQFDGSIVAYDYAPAAIQKVDNVDLAGSNRLTIQVKIRFTNTKDPKQDTDQTYQSFRDFSSTQDIAAVNNDQVGIRRITNDIITDVFNKSVANW